MFILVRILSKHLKDRTMILFGCFILAVANGWFIYVVPRAYNGKVPMCYNIYIDFKSQNISSLKDLYHL